MAMVCPQCNGSFEQRWHCPSCGVRLLYQTRQTRTGGGSPGETDPWQQTPWGRILIGLLLAQGIYYSLRHLFTAGLLVSGVGNQLTRPTNASLITKRARRGKGAAIGIMDSFDSAGRILGPIVAGSLYGPDPRYPYLASAAILATVGTALWLRKGRRPGGARKTAPEISSSSEEP